MNAQQDRRNATVFWSAVAGAVIVDVLTKALAHSVLVRHRSYGLLGDFLQLTLVYNPGAAFGLHLGAFSRWIFLLIAVVALVVLYRMYRETHPGSWLRALALGLIAGGAAGNLINRLWSTRGVVDFIDVGIGDLRWPTFNFADIGVSIGAVLLAWVLWREDSAHPVGAAPSTNPSSGA